MVIVLHQVTRQPPDLRVAHREDVAACELQDCAILIETSRPSTTNFAATDHGPRITAREANKDYNPRVMLRRTLLQIAAALVVFRPLRTLARVLQPPGFSAANIETLTAIAGVVLPSELSTAERQRVVDRFVAWFTSYREG